VVLIRLTVICFAIVFQILGFLIRIACIAGPVIYWVFFLEKMYPVGQPGGAIFGAFPLLILSMIAGGAIILALEWCIATVVVVTKVQIPKLLISCSSD
jgi:hypothetical protein